MSLPERILLVARAHGATARPAGLWALAWVAVPAANGLTLPAINPDLSVQSRPMESVMLILLCAPAGILALVGPTPLSWLHARRSRRTRSAAALWTAALLIAQCIAAAAAVVALPDSGLVVAHVVGVAVALGSIALLVTAVADPRLGVVAPALLLAPFSVSAFVPWERNVVVNPALVGPLVATAAVLALAAMAAAWSTAERLVATPLAAERET